MNRTRDNNDWMNKVRFFLFILSLSFIGSTFLFFIFFRFDQFRKRFFGNYSAGIFGSCRGVPEETLDTLD
jgi:hypothetical protein